MNSPIKLLAASFWLAGIVSTLSADVRVGLITYWPLDVDNGGTTPDMGSSGNNLTEFNGPTVVSGQVSNAFSFN